MDAYEATRIVFSRLQALDPDNAAKIMGLLLIQDDGVEDMIRLAFGPENLLHSVVLKARKDLGLFPCSTPTSPFSHFPFSRSNSFSEEDVISSNGSNEFLSFLNEKNTADPVYNSWEQRACLSPDGFGWKPCLYYQKGFCKNGSACRFLHGPADDISVSIDQELMLLRSKSQRLAASAAAFPYSPTAFSKKCLNLMLQQQLNENQRDAAVALMLDNENHKFMGRARMERSDFAAMVNPSSRQIYLTFPADSTFREEDVSNYFSIYGPVQDVRIPYQQKRMFGFVTFVYPETVKLILAKGNPHFVCDARVLVKPYKEKGKIPEKKQLQAERIDFSGCNSPSGLDSRDPLDLQQLANARMLYGGNNQDVLLRRKLEEQQAAAELHQAIEMQGRRFMGLKLLDIKNRSFSSSTAPILSPLTTPTPTPTSTSTSTSTSFNNTDERNSNGSQDESLPLEDKSLSPASAALSNAAAAETAVNPVESAARKPIPNEDIHCQESAEHNLPDSPFASPTKSSFVNNIFSLDDEEKSLTNNGSSIGNGNGHLIASTLLAPTSPLENTASFKSCFFQMPRFSSGHGAVGL